MKIEEFERLKNESAGHLLIKAARIYNEFAFKEVKRKLKIDNLRPSHLQLFAHIPFEGITTVELAEKMNISKQAVSKSVNELLEFGVLIKKDNPVDSRSFLITFSKKDKSSLFQGMQELAKLDSEIESLLGKKETKKLRETLTSVISHFEHR